MRVKMITSKARHLFKHLISPGAYQLMERGEPVTAMGLLDEKTPIGAVVGILDENDIFTVLSLYVAEEHRRRGGGSMLIYMLETLMEEVGGGMAVLSYVEEPGKENRDDAIIPFMESLEIYEATSLEHLYEVPIGSFYTPFLFPEDFRSRLIRPISDLTEREKEAFWRQYNSLNDGWMGDWFYTLTPDPELSFVSIKDDVVSGYLLFEKDKLSDTEPVINISRDSNSKVAGMLLSAFVSACRNKFPPDKKVLLPVPDDRYERLFEQLHDVRNLQHNYIL